MSNYPPGVTGNEYEIAGPDYEREIDGECPECGEDGTLMAVGYRSDHWTVCSACDHQEDRQPEEPDWEAIAEAKADALREAVDQ